MPRLSPWSKALEKTEVFVHFYHKRHPDACARSLLHFSWSLGFLLRLSCGHYP
jgi:hypothetical protein